jgi:hypothetical protein
MEEWNWYANEAVYIPWELGQPILQCQNFVYTDTYIAIRYKKSSKKKNRMHLAVTFYSVLSATYVQN